MEDYILRTNNLSIGYQTKQSTNIIIRDIDVVLPKGKLICLLGPNGVGKSTLIRTLAGLHPPISGEVFIKEKNILQYSQSELARKISLVLTDKMVTGNLTVLDLVSIGRHPHTDWSGILKAEDTRKISEAIENTQVNYLINRRLFEISDGQAQKAMIARALSQDGEIMILDEPTAHLDLNNKVEIMLLLKKLAQKTGKSILVATHELELALKIADSIWLAQCDQPILTGLPEEMVLNGHINQTFFGKDYRLDLETGEVKINNPTEKSINLVGSGAYLFWTRHALERLGFFISEDDPVTIQIDEKDDKVRWVIKASTNENAVNSLAELLQAVEQLKSK